MFDLGFEFEKTFDLGFKFEKKRYGMFFECLCRKKNGD